MSKHRHKLLPRTYRHLRFVNTCGRIMNIYRNKNIFTALLPDRQKSCPCALYARHVCVALATWHVFKGGFIDGY